jgi:hypothetical protein
MTTILSNARGSNAKGSNANGPNVLGGQARNGGRAVLMLGIGISAIAARYLYRKFKQRESRIHTEEARDEALTESFPASDPPATQYFDIPENRQ